MNAARSRPIRSVTVGDGPTILLLHGYGMQPSMYLPMARLLADRAHVVIPAIFALPERWTFAHALDWEAVHPIGILRMASRSAATTFIGSWATHPVQLSTAALWAFFSNRAEEIQTIADAGIPCHVLWASHDTILSRADGAEFARLLGATFTVAERPPGYGPIDHDWMFDDPDLFVDHL